MDKVSRRGAPVSTNSSKRTVSQMAKAASAVAAPAKTNKKMEDGIEMRPLLAATKNDEQNHVSPEKAEKFASSWLGTMIKVKAKQAEKHAYNLRANLKSKKGFHVVVPKRMLFYTILVFLVLPLILFMYKENHIHDHDPDYHNIKRRYNATKSNSTASSTRTSKLKKKKKAKHASLKQLIGGDDMARNATSRSKSKPASRTDVDQLGKSRIDNDNIIADERRDGGITNKLEQSAIESSENEKPEVSESKQNATLLSNMLSAVVEKALDSALGGKQQEQQQLVEKEQDQVLGNDESATTAISSGDQKDDSADEAAEGIHAGVTNEDTEKESEPHSKSEASERLR